MTMGTAGHQNQSQDASRPFTVCLAPLTRMYRYTTTRDHLSGWWVLKCNACGHEEPTK